MLNFKERAEKKKILSKQFLGGFLIILALGIVFTAIQMFRETAWQETAATLNKATIEEPNDSEKSYRLFLTYSYQVAGKPYTARSYKGQSADKAHLEAEIKDLYQPGAQLNVYFDPSEPQNSSANKSSSPLALAYLVLAGLAGSRGIRLIKLKYKPKDEIPPEDY